MSAVTVLLGVVQLLTVSVLNVVLAAAYLVGGFLCTGGRAKRALRPTCVLITGATSGIGEGLALEYAKQKDAPKLLLTGRNEARLEEVRNACRELGAEVVTHQGNVTDKEAMAQFIQQEDDETPIDLVIANAGVTEATAGADRDIVAATERLFDINVIGVFNTILPLVERMKERRRGQIALMSSLAGFGGIPSMTAYAASKNAIRAYGHGLRGLLFRYNISVNVVMPGFVKSPMTDKVGSSKPLMWSRDKAVKHIVAGLRNDESTIAFPALLVWIIHYFQSLPLAVRDWAGVAGLFGELRYFKKRKADREAEAALRAK